jgi:hypothetical protein
VSALTPIVGYPCHRPVRYWKWTNQHGIQFTEWVAACGAEGYLAGAMSTFGKAGEARRLELCATCFPGRNIHAHFPDPIESPADRGGYWS